MSNAQSLIKVNLLDSTAVKAGAVNARKRKKKSTAFEVAGLFSTLPVQTAPAKAKKPTASQEVIEEAYNLDIIKWLETGNGEDPGFSEKEIFLLGYKILEDTFLNLIDSKSSDSFAENLNWLMSDKETKFSFRVCAELAAEVDPEFMGIDADELRLRILHKVTRTLSLKPALVPHETLFLQERHLRQRLQMLKTIAPWQSGYGHIRAWLDSNDTTDPMSFVSCCLAFELDPLEFRAQLANRRRGLGGTPSSETHSCVVGATRAQAPSALSLS
jgi:hypothetical protein